MSLIDEILVLLDDNKDIKLSEAYEIISKRSKQIISSTVGRLVAKGWVHKTGDKDARYNLTKNGRERLYTILDNIQNIGKRSDGNNWLILVFTIPEKNRKKRDDLRKYLVENGFGRLQSSVWLSYWDKQEKILHYANLRSIQNNLVIFNSKRLSNKQNIELVNRLYWNWRRLNILYKKFINEAKSFLKNMKKDSFRAKILVISYAKVLQEDPKLPKYLRPKRSLTEEAYLMYVKIRPYCYKK